MPRKLIAAVAGTLLAVGAGLALGAAPSAHRAAGNAGTRSRAARHLICPRNDRRLPVSRRPGSREALVSPGPRSVLLCRYTPLGGPRSRYAQSLIARRLITRAGEAQRLARELDAIPAHPGAYSCPADWGENILAAFRYASGPDNPVTVDLAGCESVTNGRVHQLGLGATVVSRLGSLVEPAPSRLRVHLRVCGGPAPGGCRIESFTDCGPSGCVRLDRVLASFDWTARPPRTTRLRRGRASLTLPAGRYTVALFGSGRHAARNPVQTAHVTLRPHRTATVTFAIAVP